MNGRKLDSSDASHHAGPGQLAGENSLDIVRFLDLESQRRDVLGRSASRGHDEKCLREGFPYLECSVGVLEAVREDEVESARSEIAHRILEIGGRGGLHHR